MKIRTNYVSNSSSSSFILKNKEDAKLFQIGWYANQEQPVYSTDEIKETIKLFLTDFVKNIDNLENIDENKVWEKYFQGKVPDYFEYNYVKCWAIENWNFSGLYDLIRLLPAGKWITDSYDRDWVYENHLDYLEVFEGDL